MPMGHDSPGNNNRTDQINDKNILEAKIKKIDDQIALLSTLRQNLIDKLNPPDSIKSQITTNPLIKEFTPEKINLFHAVTGF